MSIHLIETPTIGPGSRYVREKRELLLDASKEELASLRFSILVTAKWERSASEDGDEERRDELRDELAGLRRQYAGKIDEIAMTFGVQSAMEAKEEVERTVAISKIMNLTARRSEDDEDSDSGI